MIFNNFTVSERFIIVLIPKSVDKAIEYSSKNYNKHGMVYYSGTDDMIELDVQNAEQYTDIDKAIKDVVRVSELLTGYECEVVKLEYTIHSTQTKEAMEKYKRDIALSKISHDDRVILGLVDNPN